MAGSHILGYAFEMSRDRLLTKVCIVAVTVQLAGLALAQSIPADGSYLVKPGDTLGTIAAQFGKNWKEIHALNPGITNPDRITPGTRIMVGPAPKVVAARRATIQQVVRQVEQMPFPQPWTAATVGGVLGERDGVRTFEKSSSELRFDNDARMIVSEESVVFLRETPAAPQAVNRRSIEIRAGQADFDVRPADSGQKADIEFQVGSTRGVTKPGAEGRSSARAKRAQDGGSRVMVYEGASDVEAGGKAFAVDRGMGAAVTADGKTNGPERLLPAPSTAGPRKDQIFDYSNPRFDWDPVAGASSYTVEICRDADCGQLVDRQVNIKSVRWTPRTLPLGALYWRVTAVSGSGLDGYSSQPVKFVVRTYWRRPLETADLR